MTIARPGRAASRFPRALAMLFVLALAFVASGAGSRVRRRDSAPGPPHGPRHRLGDAPRPALRRIRPVALRFMLCECQVDLLGRIVDSTARPSSSACARIPPRLRDLRPGHAPKSALGALAAGIARLQSSASTSTTSTAPPDSDWPASPALRRARRSPSCTTCSTGGIPYLDRVVIGQPAPCMECPPRVCPNDSIDVFLAGTFPDDCTHLEGVALFPSMLAAPLPQPPIVRITYGTASCLGRPCVMQPQPWAARVRLPGAARTASAVPCCRSRRYLHDLCTPDSIGTFLARRGVPLQRRRLVLDVGRRRRRSIAASTWRGCAARRSRSATRTSPAAPRSGGPGGRPSSRSPSARRRRSRACRARSASRTRARCASSTSARSCPGWEVARSRGPDGGRSLHRLRRPRRRADPGLGRRPPHAVPARRRVAQRRCSTWSRPTSSTSPRSTCWSPT